MTPEYAVEPVRRPASPASQSPFLAAFLLFATCTPCDQLVEPLVVRARSNMFFEQVPEPQEPKGSQLPAFTSNVHMTVSRPPLLGVDVEQTVQIQAQALKLRPSSGHIPGLKDRVGEHVVFKTRYEELSAGFVREVDEAIPLVPHIHSVGVPLDALRKVYVVNVAQIGCALEKVEEVRLDLHAIGNVPQHECDARLLQLVSCTLDQILLVDLFM